MTKPFIVAELSANHGGSLHRALDIVKATADAGATAIKLQTYRPHEMVGDPDYIIPDGHWREQRLMDLYLDAATPWEWHRQLFDAAKELGIMAFSSPFSISAVEFLETLNCPMYKIASFEIVDLPLIKACARTGKPLIISTGMATKAEIAEAVCEARSHGCEDITLLKCTSAYPATVADANLATMVDMQRIFDVNAVGVSDHTPGIAVSVAAVALGARMVEKHLCLSRTVPTPDAHFSLEPDEFEELVNQCNQAHDAVGGIAYGPRESEKAQVALRRSLYFARSMKRGETVTVNDVRTARPALGLPPRELPLVVGQTVLKNVVSGEPVTWEAIS